MAMMCAGAVAVCAAQDSVQAEAAATEAAVAGTAVAGTAVAEAAARSDVADILERMERLEAAFGERLAQLEAANKAQAERIAELERQNKALADAQSAARDETARGIAQARMEIREETRRELAQAKDETRRELAQAKDETRKDIAQAQEESRKELAEATALKWDPSTERSASGRIFTTDLDRKYYLADSTARIFEPLTESGLQFTPYGYLTFEAVHNTHKTDSDIYSAWVQPRGNGRKNGDHQSSMSMNDSIFGFNAVTPELDEDGWRFMSKFEFDFAGDNANDPEFHLRHLYFAMDNEEAGWNILFGQTWHLWKMVTPNEIDGNWMAQTGYPYRRSPQLRVTKTFKFEDESTLEVRAGLVKNGNGMGGDRDGDDNQDNSASAWPLLEGALVYERKAPWEREGRKLLLGLAGMYGRDKSHRFDLGADGEIERYGESDEYDTSMVMGAASIPFLDKFTLTGQFFAGENLSGIQAGIGQGVAMEDSSRKGSEVQTVGGFLDLRYDHDQRWAFALGYGFDDPRDSRARYAAGRTFNERAYADVFYRFNANLHFALEYARLRTRYYYDDDATCDRVQFTAFYDF